MSAFSDQSRFLWVDIPWLLITDNLDLTVLRRGELLPTTVRDGKDRRVELHSDNYRNPPGVILNFKTERV